MSINDVNVYNRHIPLSICFSTLLSKFDICGILRIEMITSEQCRAARALLNWSQGDLANEAGVGVVTVRQLEAAVHVPRRATLEVIRRALEVRGRRVHRGERRRTGCPITKAATEKGLGVASVSAANRRLAGGWRGEIRFDLRSPRQYCCETVKNWVGSQFKISGEEALWCQECPRYWSPPHA